MISHADYTFIDAGAINANYLWLTRQSIPGQLPLMSLRTYRLGFESPQSRNNTRISPILRNDALLII
jgi:hypothetical protein